MSCSLCSSLCLNRKTTKQSSQKEWNSPLSVGVGRLLQLFSLPPNFCLLFFIFYFKEMLSVIHQETQHPHHADFGMFVLVIMSHGGDDSVYGADDPEPIKLTNVFDLLTPVKFRYMARKPKFIIVQACSGGKSIYTSVRHKAAGPLFELKCTEGVFLVIRLSVYCKVGRLPTLILLRKLCW